MASTHRSHDSEDTVFMADSATTLPLPAKRVSWGAVIAGMVIAVVVQLVLSLLGAGVGLGAFDPLGYSSPDASTFGISAAIWWAISSVVALFVGGWVAGHLCGSLEKTDAVLHGLLTWGVGTIVTVYLITAMVSSVVRGGAAVIGKAASIATSGAVAGSAADLARSAVPGGDVSAASLRAPTAALLAPAAAAASSAEPGVSQASAAASETSAASASAGSTAPAGAVEPILQRILASGATRSTRPIAMRSSTAWPRAPGCRAPRPSSASTPGCVSTRRNAAD